MSVTLAALADQLQLIEAELRRLGCWDAGAPSAAALASTQPFSIDTLAFEQWLQWILLPKMEALIARGGPLPSISGIAPMAEVAFQGRTRDYSTLLTLLAGFDRMIEKR